MKTITISKVNLKKIHDVACSTWKTKLEGYANRNPFDSEVELTDSEVNEMFDASDEKQTKVLNKYFDRPKSIMDKVKSFEDACDILGIYAKDITKLDIPKHLLAQMKIEIVVEALNEGWEPDFSNHNQYKYFPWFEVTSESVFRFYVCSCDCSFIGFSSALYYKSSTLAEHGAKIAYNEYKEYYLNK